MNSCFFRFCVMLTIVGLGLCPIVPAQTIPADDIFRPHRWDSAHGIVYFGKGLATKQSSPLRAYYDGQPQGGAIDLFRDFPHLRKAVVDDFAPGPNQTTFVAVVLNFGSTLRHVILTYDDAGKLLSVLDTEPYYVQAVTTDDKGNLYTLGNKLEGNKPGSPSYPLLVKYDAKGQVVGEGLNSSLFKNGSQAVNQNSNAVDPTIMWIDGKLLVYAPLENTVLLCEADGRIIRQTNLDKIIATIQRDESMKRIDMESVAFVDEDRVVLDLIGYSEAPKSHADVNVAAMHPAAYQVNLVTGRYAVVLRGQMSDWNFLGVKNRQLLLLSPFGGRASTNAHNLPGD